MIKSVDEQLIHFEYLKKKIDEGSLILLKESDQIKLLAVTDSLSFIVNTIISDSQTEC